MLSTGLKTAWNENPAIAVQLAHRFPSIALSGALRFYLLSFPEKIIGDCDALEMLLGPSLPHDVTFQLKVCLWFLFNLSSLTLLVPSLLGLCEPNYCGSIFSSLIWQ